jgi:predicted nucleotidyltransferase
MTETPIARRLREIENEENIRILYACESGSRAWGFASPDSDFDIRFIYKRPLNDYLTLKEFKDTLEYPLVDNLDFGGWDIKKFLLHLGKSNGVMFEWLQSPIVYLDNANFRQYYLNLMPKYFSPRPAAKHYLGLAKRTLLDFGDESHVKIKKYFYILRPFFAARWICQKRTVPPMEFQPLFEAANLNDTERLAIVDLQKQKENLEESAKIPRLSDLESYITAEMNSYESDFDELNRLFVDTVVQSNYEA